MLKELRFKTDFTPIEVLRFPLMILVLFVHVIPSDIHLVRLSFNPDSMYSLVSELISHHLGRTAVPCFFLFSGYFFFLKIGVFDTRSYAAQLSKRWKTLLLPYLLWNMLLVSAAVLKNFVFGKLGMAEDDLYALLQRSSYYDILWGDPFLFPFWYLRDLICMTVLSPLFYLLFKYTGKWGLLLLALAYLLVWETNIPGFGTTAILFFGAGAFMGLYKYDLAAVSSPFGHYWLLLTTFLLGTAMFFSATPLYEYWIRAFAILGVLSWINLGNFLARHAKLRDCLRSLSSTVFFIYAVHEFYIINWLKGGFVRLPLSDDGWGKLIAYFSIPVLCLLVCLGLYRVFKIFLPNVLAVLIGGRITVESVKK